MTSDEEKQRVRERQRGYKQNEIKVIKATEFVSLKNTQTKLRVCAYCRVSTNNIEQTSSIELQKVYYKEYIEKHENWEMVNIFVDEGISGTSLAHRTGFNQMLQVCYEGKIDLIVTKSVSRFSRNVVDCITVIRKLKSLTPPVRVFFESEGIDTGDSTSDIMLNILAIFAQEESHIKSEIMQWSIDNRFARGIFLTPRLFGYNIVSNKPNRYEINEEEAEIVRLVYSLYIIGYSPKEIADKMQELNYVSNIKGERKWSAGTVTNILNNERRCGMVIARKTYTPDFTTHKTKKNINQRNKYQLDNHHVGIVTIDLYKEFLKIKKIRRNGYYDLIPCLSVIKDGALKGFVPVSIKYSGFTYDNYLFASNFAYEKDKNGNVIKDEIKPIYKKDLSNFDLSGFEKVDTQLISNVGQPMCWFKGKQMYFNRACIDKIKNTGYIELLFEPTEKLLAVRSCTGKNEYAISCVVTKDVKSTSLIKSSSGFSRILFDCMEWNIKFKYKMVGVSRHKENESVVLFDLNKAEAIYKEELESEDSYDKTLRIISYIDEYLINHFGNDFYQDIYSRRLYLMDLFKKWQLDAELVPIDNAQQWLIDARNLVEKHLSKIMEE